MFETSGTLLSGMTCTCSEIAFKPSGLISGGGGEGACATSASDARRATTPTMRPAHTRHAVGTPLNFLIRSLSISFICGPDPELACRCCWLDWAKLNDLCP